MSPLRLAAALALLASSPALACTTNLAISATSSVVGGNHRIAITLTNTSAQNFLSHRFGQKVQVIVGGALVQEILFTQVFVGRPVTLTADLPIDDHITRAQVAIYFNPLNVNDAYPNDDCTAGDNTASVRLN